MMATMETDQTNSYGPADGMGLEVQITTVQVM